jgi:hypothetical protein
VNDTVFLKDAMLAEAEAVGLRLRACVREALLRSFGTVPTAHDLGSATGLDGVVSKRIVKLLREGPGPDVLTHAPSVANLRDFASALESRCDLGPLESFALRDAIRKFEKFIQAFGGSKGELTRVLRARESETAEKPVSTEPRWAVPADGGRLLDASDGAPLASVTDLNPLNEDPEALADRLESLATAGTVITWSGSLADELFARDPGAWGGERLDQLGKLCRDLAPELRRRGVRWLLRPHCRHALCDPQRCVSFLRTQISGGAVREAIGIALDPSALLEESMLNASSGGGATPEDFVSRAIRVLGPVSEWLLLSSVKPAEQAVERDFEDALLPERCPLGEGVLDMRRLSEDLRSVAPFLKNVAPVAGDPRPQLDTLRAMLAGDDA